MNPTSTTLAVRQRLASLLAPRVDAGRKPLRHVGRVLAVAVVASTLVGFDDPSSSCDEGLEPLVLSAPPGGIVDGELVLCTHGPDAHLLPDGIHSTDGQASGQASAQVAFGGAVPTAPAQCYGDGHAGTRVQAIYAHEQGTTNRATALDADLRRWVGQTEWTVTASAARAGGRRYVRWVTEAGGSGACRVAIEALTLPAGSLDNLSTLANALAARGYQRADRKYLVFADVDHGSCGIAVAPNDDRAGRDNRANTTVGYARVDRDCWSVGDAGFYAVAAHELVHTLGGVQASALHATEGRHCTDEWDVMCYVDGAAVSTTEVCVDNRSDTSRDDDTNNRLLDCNHDDYFHTAPPRGSYLANHWNVANSTFLKATPGDGRGFSTHPRVVEDPQGRQRLWSGDLGGAHRPLLVDAYGWEACDLPIRVVVHSPRENDGGGDGSLLGQVVGRTGSGAGPSDVLRSAVSGATATVNRAVGRTVVELDRAAWSGGEPAEGTLLVRWGDTAGSTHVAVMTRAARIRAATVTVNASLAGATAAQRDVWILQGVVQALGVGRVGGSGTLMAPYPKAGADQRQAMAALKFLYGQSCNVDPRLGDTAPGDASQRQAGGTRRRVDLAAQAQTPIAASVAVAAWLRSERGDGWASRAVVCRDDVHADCLAGTVLIGDAGPILYVPGGANGRLPNEVRDELRASVRTGGTVTVLGGSQAVSDDVLDTLRSALSGRQVRRIAGPDRFATAAEVARVAVTTMPSDRVLLARADVPADAVAAGAAAAEFGLPVLLTASDVVPAATLNALTDIATRNVIITGGPVAVSGDVVATLRARGHEVSRVAGRTRSETAVAIARASELWNRVSVRESGSVIGLNGWHDQTWTLALAAAAVGAYLDAPVVFTTRDTLPSEAPSMGFPGDTAHQLRNLPVIVSAPSVTTVHVGGTTWSNADLIEAFHGSILPGFDGNVSRTSRAG